MDISIPAFINNIPVEYIGDFAFREDNYDYIVYTAEDSDANTWYDTVKENLILRGYTFTGAYFIRRTGTKLESELQKTCLRNYSDRTGTNEKIMYEFEDDTYIGCGFTTSSFQGLENSEAGNITSVDLSKATNLKNIGYAAFIDNKIESIYFGNNPYLSTLGTAVFKNNIINGTINLSGLINLKTTGNSTFQNDYISHLILPNGLEEIGMNSFYMNSLDTLNLPNSLKIIGDWSFSTNPIHTINLHNNLETIGDYAFALSSLSGTLTIPEGITVINQGAFNQVSGITSLVLGTNVEIIEDYAFAKTSLKSIDFNDKLITIGKRAFWECKLRTLEFPASLRTIDSYAFWNNKINNIIFNEELESIEEYAFKDNCLTLPVSTPIGTTVRSNTFNNNPVSAEICQQ